ncbi:FERM domain-containing protein 4B [Cricetulus griseus]|nr:FERM domain-containing protein 4B [Cricetulus griseus]
MQLLVQLTSENKAGIDKTFYIESISFLKDKNTVELFFLNAKACVHKSLQYASHEWCKASDLQHASLLADV